MERKKGILKTSIGLTTAVGGVMAPTILSTTSCSKKEPTPPSVTTPIINFNDYKPSMEFGDSNQTITAHTNDGTSVSLSAEGENENCWYFDKNTGVLSYDKAVSSLTTITITATSKVNSTVTNKIKINLLPEEQPQSITATFHCEDNEDKIYIGVPINPLTTYIEVMANNVPLPSDGKRGIVGMPAGINYEWTEEGNISLSGKAVDTVTPGNYDIEITVGDKSVFTNVVIPLVKAPDPQWFNFSYSESEYKFTEGSISTTLAPIITDNYTNIPEVNYLLEGYTLPAGLTLNATNGEISGTPKATGHFPITVTARGNVNTKWVNIDAYANIVIDITLPEPTSLELTYTSDTYSFEVLKDGVTTGEPTLEDNNGTIITNATYSVVGSDEQLPAGLNLNTSTGEISGNPSSAEKRMVTIKAIDNDNVSLEITKTITIDIVFTNVIVVNNDIVKITNPDGFMKSGSSSATRLNNTTYTDKEIANVSDIKEIYITPTQTTTDVGDDYGKYLCYQMGNLTIANINIPQGITTIGNNFCQYMFYGCSNLTRINDDFNFPQYSSLTSVGTSFAQAMFLGCINLVSLPENFNLPQSLTSVGTSFCYSMFAGCSALKLLPPNFNLPQNLSTVPNEFVTNMFSGCISLTRLSSEFNFPASLTSVGNDFGLRMFYGCSSLLGAGINGRANFKIPVELEERTNFASGMFSGATILLLVGCDESPTSQQLFNGYNIAKT